MSIKHRLILLSLTLTMACSPGSSSNSPTSSSNDDQQKTGTGEPAQGQINGQQWSFRSGRAYIKQSPPASMIVQLWSDPISLPCQEKTGSILQMRLTAPNEVGSWTITPEDPFNGNLSIFFADLDFHLQPRDNMRADRGEVTLLSIDKDSVSGVVKGSFQNPRVGGTRVSGDFTVPFCP
jgi:hypothetical protein